jgi:ADP-ribosylglycohydrolase
LCGQLLDEDSTLKRSLQQLEAHLVVGSTPEQFAESLGLKHGVSGFIEHTVPAVLFCWLRSAGNFRQALIDVINLGGDTDSTGAILGGIAGATTGAAGIPREWIDGIWECDRWDG